MFYVKKQEYVNKTFRLPIELVEQLSALAQSKNVSVNFLVLQCCEYALNNMAVEESSDTPEKSE